MVGFAGMNRLFRFAAAFLAVFFMMCNVGSVEAKAVKSASHQQRVVKSTSPKKKQKVHHKAKKVRAAKKAPVAKTQYVHGMLAEYNSLGYQQIRVDGSGEMLKVKGWTQTSEKLTQLFGVGHDRFAREVHGDFGIKVTQGARPGEYAEAKIVSARNITVMNRGRAEFRAPTLEAAVAMEPRYRHVNSRVASGDKPVTGPELAPEYRSQDMRL